MEEQSHDGEAIIFLLLSGHFCGVGRGLDGEGLKVVMGDTQVPPPLKPCRLIFLVPDPLL